MTDKRFLQDGFDKQLGHLIEEMGEVGAAAGKTLRWGPLSTNPLLPPNEREANITWLWREMHDLQHVLNRLALTMQADFPVECTDIPLRTGVSEY